MAAGGATGTPKMVWAGRIISGVVIAMLVLSAVMKFTKGEEVVKGFEHLGYDMSMALGLGVLELACTAVYLFPQTAVLGAILLTGYLGGATATHVRVGDPINHVLTPVGLGMLAWLALFLRDPRIRALIPWRQ